MEKDKTKNIVIIVLSVLVLLFLFTSFYLWNSIKDIECVSKYYLHDNIKNRFEFEYPGNFKVSETSDYGVTLISKDKNIEIILFTINKSYGCPFGGKFESRRLINETNVTFGQLEGQTCANIKMGIVLSGGAEIFSHVYNFIHFDESMQKGIIMSVEVPNKTNIVDTNQERIANDYRDNILSSFDWVR